MNRIATHLILLCILFFASCISDRQKPEKLNLASGSVERIENFESKYIPSRNIDVWLPEDYSSDNKYAVLYMHDGQMLFDSTTTWNKQEWGVDEIMGKLIREDKIRKTIVVGIWNTEYRHSEYFPQKPFAQLPKTYRDSLLLPGKENDSNALFKTDVVSDKYLQFIVEELKPHIDKNYSTHSDRENTFIAGSSMGGLISMYALSEYPDVFYGAACLSTHWIGVFDTINNPIPLAFSEYVAQHLPDSSKHKLYFDYGTETLDAFYEPYQLAIDSILLQKGYNDGTWKTLKFEGENHSERAWHKRLSIPLQFLLKKDKN